MTVTLIKQSYNEAIKSGSLPTELKFDGAMSLVGMVGVASTTGPPFDKISEIEKKLMLKAEELGADYVFGIEYKAMFGATYDSSGGTIAYGDAYKVVERKKLKQKSGKDLVD